MKVTSLQRTMRRKSWPYTCVSGVYTTISRNLLFLLLLTLLLLLRLLLLLAHAAFLINLKLVLQLSVFLLCRCGIPVVIMGETGCGKTKLIRYLCGLQKGMDGPKNMLLVKVFSMFSFRYFNLSLFLHVVIIFIY